MRWIRRWSLLALGLLLASAVVGAAEPRNEHLAQAESVRTYRISPGPLGPALNQVAAESGLQLVYDAELVQGLRTPGLTGTFGPEEVLSRLLAGTGLAARFTDPRTVRLERMAEGSTMPGRSAPETRSTASPRTPAEQEPPDVQLPQMRVRGVADRESAYGPVTGYVATRGATATKTDTPLLETPQSLSVVTRDQMDAQAVQSVPQALRYTVGVVPEPRGSMTKLEFLYTRGFLLDQYLDGLRLLGGSWGVPQIEQYGLERIEVLKGPASVLYGQASPGGLVNLVSKRPTPDPLYEVQLEVGSFDRFQGAFDLSGPIDERGRFLYRLTGLARDSDTQVLHQKEQRLFIAPALTWRLTPDTTLTILTNYQRDPAAGHYNWVPAYGTVLRNPNGKLHSDLDTGDPSFDTYDRAQYGAGYLFEHRFDDTWTVRQNLRYNHIDTEYDNVFSSFLDTDLRTLFRYLWHDREKFDALTFDTHVEARFQTGPLRHTVLLGVDFQRLWYDQRLGFDFGGAPTLDVFNPVYHQPIETPPFTQHSIQQQQQVGLYGQNHVRLGNWAFLLGARHDWVSTDTVERFSDFRDSQSDGATTWRAGAVYLFDCGLAPYASYAKSFQPTGGTDFDNNPFKPTTGEQYEVGIKYQPRGVRAFMTLSAYQLTQQNVLTSDPAHPGFSTQTGEIRSRGIEVAGVAEPVAGLSLIASYAYLRNIVTKSNDVDNPFGSNLGKHPTGMPEHTASLWSDYTFQLGPLRGFGLGAGVRYVGATEGDALNTFKVPASTVVDAAVHYDLAGLSPMLKGLRLGVNVTNIADREYVASCDGVDFCAFGLRRTVVGTMTYRW